MQDPRLGRARAEGVAPPPRDAPGERRAVELEVRCDVFSAFQRYLKKNGVLSYFEYVAMRRTSRALSMGKSRRRIRSVSRFLNERIKHHQFARQTVFRNFPPAYARYMQFRDVPEVTQTGA